MASVTTAVPSKPPRLIRFIRPFTTFPFAVGSLVALGVFVTIRDFLPDPDIFWHLRNAQYMVTHHRLVSSEMYSFTAPGSPYLSHEWLSDLVYYGFYGAFGWPGVLALFSAAFIVIVLTVYWLARREGADPIAATVAAIVGKLLLDVSAGPRMQLLGWLCFLPIFAILQKYRHDRTGPLWAIPILFCLWINLHGGWLAGFAACALIVLSGLVRRDIGNLEASPWTGKDLRNLLLTGVASMLAVFVNPMGYKTVLFPFEMMFRMPLQQQFVIEWQPISFWGTTGNHALIVLAVVFMVAVFGKNRWRIDEVLLVLFVLYFGLKHQRLLVLAGILLPVILARHIGAFSSYGEGSERRKLNFAISCLAVVAMVLLFPSSRKLQAGIDKEYPADAVAFIRSHHINGRMFNWYNWGGYLEWSLPEFKTFIDGRADIFEPQGVLKDYLDTAHLVRSRELLDQYQITFVLISRETPLAYLLNNTKEWRQIYQDAQSALFERAP